METEVKSLTTNRRLTVFALLCTVFLAAMEATAVATVMPRIVADLGGIDRYSWVFTAYMMCSTITVPIYGKLADLFGRKPVLQGGIGLFLVGSLLSATAGTMNTLILFRAIQGLGAGAIQPMGLTIIGDLFKIEERAKITAVFGTVWGVAGILGPMLGSLIVSVLGWPWIFLVNLPFGIMSAFILQTALQENLVPKKIRLDWQGALFLTISITAVLLAVNSPNEVAWLLPFAIVALIVFLLVEQRAEEPMVPLHLFSNPIISNSGVISLLIGATMLTLVTYLPLYVQGARSRSIFEAGLSIIPMGVGWPLASGFSAQIIKKIGVRGLLRFGLSSLCLGNFLISLSAHFVFPIVTFFIAMGLVGIGMGATSTPLLFAVQNSVTWNHRGVATASTLFFRTIGGTIAVGIMGAVLNRALHRDLSVSPNLANIFLSRDHGRSLPADTIHRLESVLEYGLRHIFYYAAAISILALVVGFLFPKTSLSPPQANANGGNAPTPSLK